MLVFARWSFPLLLSIWFAALTAPATGATLTVRITAHKLIVIVGEPVLITATVVNKGSQPVKLIYHNAPTLKGFSVVDLLFGADEKHMGRWSDRLRPRRRTEAKLLLPRERVTIDLVMLFNSRDGFFTERPGRYWIQGRIVANNIGEVLSQPYAIEVREPSSSDHTTWDWLNAHKEEYGRLVQIPWAAKLSNEFVDGCRQLCATSNSVYVEYLTLFLSRWYQEGPGKDRAEAVKYAEIAKARASSKKVRDLAAAALTDAK